MISQVIFSNSKNIYTNKYPTPTFKGRETGIISGDVVEFKKPDALNAENKLKLDDLFFAYKQITKILEQKTFSGINDIINESKKFDINDGLTFKKVGENNENVSFEIKPINQFKNYTKILVKDKDGQIKEGFLIYNNLNVLKNYDISNPNKIPDEPKFYTKSEMENLKIEKRLEKIIEDIDFPMLETRMLVTAKKDVMLKPKSAKISEETITNIANIKTLKDKINSIISEIPDFTMDKLKNEYGDYCFGNENKIHEFKNVGLRKERIVLAQMLNSYSEKFLKLSVYNKDDSLKDAYLFKDDKIVSNYNPQKPDYIPDELKFVNEEEIKDKRFNEELNSYLTNYKDKMNNFSNFIIKRKQTNMSLLSIRDENILSNINKLYDQTLTAFDKVGFNSVNKIKTEYDDYDLSFSKKGYTLKNVGKNKKIVNIYYQKINEHECATRIVTTNSDLTNRKFITIKNGKQIINNPRTSKNENEANLDILNDLSDIKRKLNDFTKFAQKRSDQILQKKFKEAALDGNIAICGNEKPLTEMSDLDETNYQKLLLNCPAELKILLKNMEKSLNSFDGQVKEMRYKLAKLIIEKNKNNKDSR